MRFLKHKKYEGFSLVEMLLTIAIIGIVMTISAVTLTTLIKVSLVSSNKVRVRNESEFVLELVRRTVRNSNSADIYIFKTDDDRTFDPETLEITNVEEANIAAAYATNLGEGEVGSEIHFRPYGYENWICIGFFRTSVDVPNAPGYILKTTAENLYDNHASCFDNDNEFFDYAIALNSDTVLINNFNIEYTASSENNVLIKFDLEAEPSEWYLAPGAPVNRKVYRQTVVTTEGLIW